MTTKQITKKNVAKAVTATPELNKNLAITNNSAVEIAVVDAVASNSSQVVYEQTLKKLTTSAGQQSIAAGATGTVVLDDYHDNAGTPTYSKLYDIIFVKPTNLYPIKSEAQMLDHATQSFAPTSVSDDEVEAMKQAEIFTQTIMANPTSQLAKDYVSVLQSSSDSSDSSGDIDAKVSAFFNNTQQFKKVTLDLLIAVKSYYNTFPMVWTGYTNSKTYYFYASDSNTVTDNGSLTISVPSTVTTDKSLPGFTFTYTDAKKNSKPLYYVNGQFVDDKSSDVPAICLMGCFTLKSTISKVDTDNAIIPILSGTINNSSVLGYDTPLQKDSNGNWSGLYTLLHPKDASGWLQLFMTFSGVVMGIEFVAKGLKTLKDKFMGEKAETGSNPTPERAAEIRSQVKSTSGMSDPMYGSLMKKINAQDRTIKDLQQQIDDLKSKLKDRLNEDQRTAMDEQLSNGETLLDKMASVSNSEKIQDLNDNLDDVWDKLDNSPTEGLASVFNDIKQSFSDIITDVRTQYSTLSSKLKGAAADIAQKAKEALDKAKEVADKVDKDSKDAEEGKTPEDAEFDGIEMDMR